MMKPLIAGLAVLAAVLGGWTLWQAQSGDRFEACRASAVAGGAGALGGPFELVDASGDTVTDAEVIDRPSILYFGYTFCPDVCPVDAARNAAAVDILTERGYDAQPVFVTVDPGRDTPEVVGDFAANLHERMIGLTGSEAQVKAASQAYRVFAQAQPGDPDYYLVDHSTFSYLVLPEHGFVEFFRREDSPEAMADRAACFIDKS